MATQNPPPFKNNLKSAFVRTIFGDNKGLYLPGNQANDIFPPIPLFTKDCVKK